MKDLLKQALKIQPKAKIESVSKEELANLSQYEEQAKLFDPKSQDSNQQES